MMRVNTRVELLVKNLFDLGFWNPTFEDRIRLLKLAQWEERYHVSLRFILQTLVPIWRKKYGQFQRGGIGVSISTLTGKVSEKILKEKIVESYPDSEHEQIWRADAQQRQLAMKRDGARRRETWQNIEKEIELYIKSMRKQRKELEVFVREQRKRPYRGNPWL